MLTESNEIHNNANSEFDYVEAVFVISGIIGVLEQWVVNEMKLPKEEIANMPNTVLLKINTQNPLFPLCGVRRRKFGSEKARMNCGSITRDLRENCARKP